MKSFMDIAPSLLVMFMCFIILVINALQEHSEDNRKDDK